MSNMEMNKNRDTRPLAPTTAVEPIPLAIPNKVSTNGNMHLHHQIRVDMATKESTPRNLGMRILFNQEGSLFQILQNRAQQIRHNNAGIEAEFTATSHRSITTPECHPNKIQAETPGDIQTKDHQFKAQIRQPPTLRVTEDITQEWLPPQCQASSARARSVIRMADLAACTLVHMAPDSPAAGN